MEIAILLNAGQPHREPKEDAQASLAEWAFEARGWALCIGIDVLTMGRC